MDKKHIALLGDSIFDNEVYVPGESPVIEQLRDELPEDWGATLLAVDGSVIADVSTQVLQLPAEATHLVVCVGGNDALGYLDLLDRELGAAADVLDELWSIQDRFRAAYTNMLDDVISRGLPTTVCTIYDSPPFPEPAMRRLVSVALSVFNDCIVRTAAQRGVPVIDLREICQNEEDYSELSPIEPSVVGGIKIVSAIVRMLRRHDFESRVATLYS